MPLPPQGPDASPDEDVERLWGCAQHFPDHRIEGRGRLTAHEPRGLASFQDDAPDSRAIFQNRCQEIHVTMIGKQRRSSHNSSIYGERWKDLLEKTGVALYPDVVNPRFLQQLPQRWIKEGGTEI